MLDRSLTYQLVSVAEDSIRHADRIFESRFGWNIHQIRVLRLIRDTPGITFTQLALLTRFERSATSRILSRLIKAGLIRRENAPGDARRFTLTITGAGQALCDLADPLSLALERMLLEPLTDTQAAVFRQTLVTLQQWVQRDYSQKIAGCFPEIKGGKAKKSRPS